MFCEYMYEMYVRSTIRHHGEMMAIVDLMPT